MSAIDQIRQWQDAARNRCVLIGLLIGLPLLVGVFLLASRFLPLPLVIGTTIIGVAMLAFAVWKSTRQFDTAWLIRQLDQGLSQLEDSSDLLFKDSSTLSGLQMLQRQRVEQRVANSRHVDLREAWPSKKIAMAFLIAAVLMAVSFFWPKNTPLNETISNPPTSNASKVNTIPVALTDQHIMVRAPAYTGLSPRSENTLQIKFPEGANLNWKLTFQPQPTSVNLLFHDDSRLALKKNGDSWQGSKVLMQSSLYRLQVNDAPLADDKLYRLDAIKDLPPQLRVLQPDRNLSLVEFGQDTWPLSFEAEDDYGLAAAQLRIQLAQGSGENIKFSEQSRSLAGQGSRNRKRFALNLDLASLGIAPGDDVIIQFSISDQRSPQINTTRSSSFILRWPPETSIEATGVEGMVQKAIPAYFRSQRQIIIDTEKLLAEKPNLSAEKLEAKSDTIGVDQRILRLRYGQFLGEEAEGGRDESASPSAKAGKDEHNEHTEQLAKEPSSESEKNLAVAAEFGHVHDIAEAATLLEPKTKELLRAALNEMWQAELHLRSAQPKLALPFEYRALAFIKKVQQADRIYLARVGLELAPVDESRRLSGDRSTLKNRSDFLQAATIEDAALIQFWQSLDQLELGMASKAVGAPNFTALRSWIREHPARSPDALGLLAAVDALEKQPRCKPCLAEMKAQLWPMLPTPAANPQQRTLRNADGQKYLDALRKERQP